MDLTNSKYSPYLRVLLLPVRAGDTEDNIEVVTFLEKLHVDDKLKEAFPRSNLRVTFKRHKNLKEILSPSCYPKKERILDSSVKSCGKCKTCKEFLVAENSFTCHATGRKYFVKGNLNCESVNVIYLIGCKNCGQQYVGSALKFKTRFTLHKSDIKTKKDRCGTSRHFNGVCKNSTNPFAYLKVNLIESVSCASAENLDRTLWEREKYWQCQLHTITKGMNSVSDLYSKQRKGTRKK